jgi:hypothetical protein
MKKVLKQNNGTALVMMIIVATCAIVLITSLLNLAYHNNMQISANGKRVSSYYIADYASEKVIKNIETIVESAKISANEQIRTVTTEQILRNPENPSTYITGISPYDYFTKYGNPSTPGDIATADFISAYETYYSNYINTNIPPINTGANFIPLSSDQFKTLPNAQYNVSLAQVGPTGDDKYKYNIKVTGKSVQNGQDKYVRKVQAQLGINPWGYDNNGAAVKINPVNLGVDLK